MDCRNAIGVIDDADLQGLIVGGWTDEHRDVCIVGLEASGLGWVRATVVRVAEARRVSLFSPVSAAGTLLASLVDGRFSAWLVDPEGTDVDAVLRLLDEMLVPLAAGGVPDGDDTRHR